MRTIIIGDIHGCFREFSSLLEKIKFDKKSDRLILLGDVIDRGFESFLVIRFCQQLKQEMQERFIHLMGNHENLMLEAYKYGDFHLWDINGGKATRISFCIGKSPIQEILPYLQTLPFYFETEAMICVHAAISKKGLSCTTKETALWERGLAKEGKYSGKLVIYGHTPTNKVIYQPGDGSYKELIAGRTYSLPETGSICLDTGCVFGNRLSAMIINEPLSESEALKYMIKQVAYGK